ncbi:MAG TPA: penicillin acylase family protein [Pyrinomonadaceae bacterium]|nr:penicillin acylase family protein [Pyrinomonadaceae bacterium]
MKIRFLVILTIFFLLASTAITLPTRNLASAQVESKTSTLQLPGLRARVIVRRDERGIPYIEAGNDEDLAFAQGYVTASDRLWQMDLFRRTERGQLAEVLTAGPNNIALEQDKQHRTLGFAQVAEAEVTQASPQSRALLEAYARGVNAYIASLDSKTTPPEFLILQYKPAPWTPADSLLVVKLFYEALSSTWRLDVMREALANLPADKRAGLMPEISPIDLVVVGKDKKPVKVIDTSGSAPRGIVSKDFFKTLTADEQIASHALARVGLYAEGLAASNNWVVSGKRTVTGKPLLANDPHLSPSAPSIWHMVHLSAPGVRVAGVTAPGLPGVVIGHNDRIAWGFTNVGPDVQDIYLEKFDTENPRRYQTPSGWKDAEVRTEEIKVRKGFADLATDTVKHEVTVTRHGPIVFEKGGRRYALRWTALNPKLNSPDSSYLINRARNWKEFSTALNSFTAPAQNIVYADVDGHIGYHVAGVVPIRKEGDGSLPYDGATDAGEWTSFVPIDKLPQLYDPPSGIIVTANQRIVGTDYPYFLTHHWAQPYRARRIHDLLSAKPKLSADDYRRILGDVYSIGHVSFAQQSVKLLRPKVTPADTKLAQTLVAFEKWDGQVNSSSTVAPMLAQMRLAFRSRILNAAIGEELFRSYGWSNFDTTIDRLMAEQPKEWLPKEFTSYGDLLKASYDDARAALTRMLGDDEAKWKWGEMVKVRFQHPLAPAPLIGTQFAIPPFAQEGSGGLAATVNVGAGVSMRLIADASDWDKTQHGISLGTSGRPSSPHWKDQLDDWKAVTPRVFPFSEAAVLKATKETLVLEPKP